MVLIALTLVVLYLCNWKNGNCKGKAYLVKLGSTGRLRGEVMSHMECCGAELKYVDKASLGYDWKIFFLNLIIIFKQDGAF